MMGTQNSIQPLINVGNPLKNARRERFCLALVGGVSQAEAARVAGYSPARADSFGNALVGFIDVRIRLIELRDILASEHIMSISARKERLSEIGQAKLRDFHNEHGVPDPFADNVPNPGALASVEQEDDLAGLGTYTTKIRLHDPVKAISELNKMERVYETGTTVNVNQSVVNVQVISLRAKELTDKVIEGERT